MRDYEILFPRPLSARQLGRFLDMASKGLACEVSYEMTYRKSRDRRESLYAWGEFHLGKHYSMGERESTSFRTISFDNLNPAQINGLSFARNPALTLKEHPRGVVRLWKDIESRASEYLEGSE